MIYTFFCYPGKVGLGRCGNNKTDDLGSVCIGKKKIMKKNKIIALLCSLALLVSMTNVYAVSTVSDNDIAEFENLAISSVEDILYDGHKEFYNIENMDSVITRTEVEDDYITSVIRVRFDATLKAEDVEDLPFVKGMLEAGGVENISLLTAENGNVNIAAVSGNISSSTKTAVAETIVNKFDELQEYIGQSSEHNFWIYVDADIVNGEIDTETLNIMAENIDHLIPIEDILPNSAEEQKAQGIATMEAVIDAPVVAVAENLGSVAVPAAYSDYRRTAARDYALAYVGEEVTTCYSCGSTCGVLQDPSEYNPNFTYYKHNDCANFVSQCLNAGDVWHDSVWYPDSYAWINTQGLKNHMLNTKGYWYSSNYANANAGAVLYTASSHVVLITLNDTVTHRYTGHTNDRYHVQFSNSSSFVYYML